MSEKQQWDQNRCDHGVSRLSAVGLGNFLRFPGQSSRARRWRFPRFLYFIALLLVGIPLCWSPRGLWDLWGSTRI